MSILLKHIADYQILKSGFSSDFSLFSGKMGIALFFYLYSRYTDNCWYEDFAGELLDDVCCSLYTSLPVTFADGLCGIGWGIEYLKKQGFIEGNTDEILVDIDRKIMERDLRRISDNTIEFGLEGIVMYVRSRIDSFRSNSPLSLFDTIYLDDLEKVCQKADIKWHTDQYNIESVWLRILDLFSSSSAVGEDSWKKGLTMIKAQS